MGSINEKPFKYLTKNKSRGVQIPIIFSTKKRIFSPFRVEPDRIAGISIVPRCGKNEKPTLHGPDRTRKEECERENDT
jgi:hypothetical protein